MVRSVKIKHGGFRGLKFKLYCTYRFLLNLLNIKQDIWLKWKFKAFEVQRQNIENYVKMFWNEIHSNKIKINDLEWQTKINITV